MFTCPHCHKQANRLIAFKDGIKCNHCAVMTIRSGFSEAHVKYNSKLEGAAGKSMTVADVNHILSRKLSDDGKRVEYKNSRWK